MIIARQTINEEEVARGRTKSRPSTRLFVARTASTKGQTSDHTLQCSFSVYYKILLMIWSKRFVAAVMGSKAAGSCVEV